jgi:hypothetical protein
MVTEKKLWLILAMVFLISLWLNGAWGQGKVAPLTGTAPKGPTPSKTAPLPAEAGTDIRILGLSLVPEKASEGQEVEARLQIGNKGDRDLSQVPIVLYLNKTPVGKHSLPRLPVGAVLNVAIPFKAAPAGRQEVTAAADPDRHIPDPDRGNNQLTRLIEIQPLPTEVRQAAPKMGPSPEKQAPTLPQAVGTGLPAGGAGAKEDHGILIQSPRGGEIFSVDSPLLIRYQVRAVPAPHEFSLFLKKTGDPSFERVLLLNSNRLTGYFTWPIPREITVRRDYYVLARAGSLWGTSEPFAITGGPQELGPSFRPVTRGLRVVSPNGGEVWPRSSHQKIEWQQEAGLGQVAMAIRRGDETLLTVPFSRQVEFDPATGRAAVGVFIPSDFPSGGGLKVRVVSSSNPRVFDESDGTFSVSESSLMIIQPTGESVWTLRNFQRIRWRISGPGHPDQLRLLLKRGRETVKEIASAVPASRGEHSWLVDLPCEPPPPGMSARSPAGGNYRVRIEGTGGGIAAESPLFPVVLPEITVTSPRGTIPELRLGDTLPILWRAERVLGDLSLLLLYPDGRTVMMKTNINSAQGRYNWMVGDLMFRGEDFVGRGPAASQQLRTPEEFQGEELQEAMVNRDLRIRIISKECPLIQGESGVFRVVR